MLSDVEEGDKLMLTRLTPVATLVQWLLALLLLLALFHKIWGFSLLSGVLGFLIKILGLFDSGQILDMYIICSVVLLYFPFKNTVVSHA